MKFLTSFLIASLLVIPSARAANLSAIEKANTLTAKGHEQLDNGNASAAYQTWAAALDIYHSEKYQEGIRGTLINQSLAYQQLGQFFNACSKLRQALEIETQLCEPNSPSSLSLDAFKAQPNDLVQLLALQNFGSVLRELGHLEDSQRVLKLAIASATKLKAQPQLQASRLSLANTYTTIFQAARQQFEISDKAGIKGQNVKTAAKYAHLAFDEFERLNQDTSLGIQAKLNWLALYEEMDQWVQRDRASIFEITAVQDAMTPKRATILQTLESADFSQLPPIESLYAKLKLAKFLAQEKQSIAGKSPLLVAFEHTQEALRQANQLKNFRALSFVYGKLGNLYSQTQQTEQAVRAYELAAQFAQSDQSWDALYQWRSELANLYQRQSDTPKAISAYQSAIQALEQVRWNLLPTSSDLQFSFKDRVEPVYQSYMKLLLQSEHPNLKQVEQINQSLRLAELENFLRCGDTNLIPLAQAQRRDQVVVHVLDLGNQTAIIVGDHYYPVDHTQIQQTVNKLTAIVQDSNFYQTPREQYLPLFQSLYQLILKPAIDQNLIPEGTPIVFNLNGPLQNIPMSMLYDGDRFLIERNPIALSTGYVKAQPTSLSSESVIIGGLSEEAPSLQANALDPLPEVKAEVEAIQAQMPTTELLLNQKFTHDRLLQKLERTTFPIFHVSTHGKFSSDPTQTYLLAWDRPLNVKDIRGALQAGNRSGSLDLLFLSACQSAQGDARSLLGLAGLSAQSGAKNTMASLWSVDADASVLFSQYFYWEIKHKVPMASALRQAQLKLLASRYAHPYYWANYVLVQLYLN